MVEISPPRSKVKPSRYAQLVGTTVTNLDEGRRERLTRVVDEVDPTGKRVLHILFPTPHGSQSIQVLDVTNWLNAPELAMAFAEMVIVWGGDKTEQTRESLVSNMNQGFFRYLATRNDKTPGLEELSTVLINGFIAWLDRREDGALIFASYTRLHYLGVVRTIIGHLKKTAGYASRLPNDLHIRRIPWPGVSRLVSHPTEILSPPVWEKLYRVCVSDCVQTMNKLEQGWKLMAFSQGDEAIVRHGADDIDSLTVCLNKLDALYPEVMPSFQAINRLDSALTKAIGGRDAVTALSIYFQPTARDLIPFVLLLGMVTAYSGNTLLGARRSDLSQTEILGSKRYVWRPYKARSHCRQYRSFPMTDAPDNPSILMPFIERWTARIRLCAIPRLHDHLFLWIPIHGVARQPHTFESKSGPTKSAWQLSLESFLKENDLPYLTLRQLRATSLDIVHDLFAGDLRAVQAAGGQQRPEVILSHYTSDAARKRNDEQLGGVMALRVRWRETEGLMDTRTLPSGQDLAAATPGWRCLDPYDSPINDQEKGKLCSAYGACPNCPLANLNARDPYSLARALQLKAKIETAQTELPALRWLKVWAPCLQRLVDYWLPSIQDPAVIAAASKLDLDELPALE
jgi:hypothetical protein